MNIAKAHAKARMAVKKREEEIETDELESGELNLVPYLDIATNILLFLLASLSSGILFGHINTSLPDHAPASSVGNNDPATPPDEQPLQLVVSITPTEIRLWSISGLEGTLTEPKARIAKRPAGAEEAYDYMALNKALKEIVERRWPDADAARPGDDLDTDGNKVVTEEEYAAAKRPFKTRQLILQADAKTPYETVIAVMDYTREVIPTDPQNPGPDAHQDLFPNIHFSTGFQ